MEHLYTTIVCTHCGHLIRVPVYCKNRFCDVCAPARRYRTQEKIKYLIKSADFTAGYFLGMVTVSLPNCLSLGEGIRKLQKSFSRLRRSALWKRSIRGGVYVIEITGSAGSWHPHIHALVEQKFISWRLFQAEWNRLTGATAFHVKKIPAGAAERYITKYLTKPAGSPADVESIAQELRHVRLFQPFGSWHGKIGSWTKAEYPCPDCGECVWLPIDLFNPDRDPIIPQERPPPGSERGVKEVLKQSRQVPEQMVFRHVMTSKTRFGDVYSEPCWTVDRQKYVL